MLRYLVMFVAVVVGVLVVQYGLAALGIKVTWWMQILLFAAIGYGAAFVVNRIMRPLQTSDKDGR
ncbi:MAG: hypothetical protein V3V97_15145 [Hyphomicrobiaceae bacterium]